MEYLIIYRQSAVAKIACKIPCIKLLRLRSLANKENVVVTFYDDKCYIEARHCRKVKVPKKIVGSEEEFLKWTEEKIKISVEVMVVGNILQYYKKKIECIKKDPHQNYIVFKKHNRTNIEMFLTI